MEEKLLIINGSPRRGGDTALLLEKLREGLSCSITEVSAFYGSISPCLDCRACMKTGECIIKDDMGIIYEDDYDAVLLAAPVYYGSLPGPVMNILSRFQPLHAARYYLGSPRLLRPKRAGLILTAGGMGNDAAAVKQAKILFSQLNASGFENHTVKSMNTDTVPAAEDKAALEAIPALADWLCGK